MPVKTVAMHVERNSVKHVVDRLDNLKNKVEMNIFRILSTSSPSWLAGQFLIARLPLMKSF